LSETLSNKTIIDLLRHGKPVGGRRYRGQLDDPLSESGWQEMWYAASAETPWQAIISSPLCRCRDFAQQLSKRLSLPITIDDRLKEVGFGAWEGQSAETLRVQDDTVLKRFYHDPVNNRPANAEPLNSFSQRVDEALQTAIQIHQGKHILIVTHAGVIRSALASTLSAPLGSMYRLSIATASLSRIRLEEQRPPTVVFMGRRRL
jgi:alpha-ribazole phosphatase/probable phosphoglycerate mutase